MSTVEQLPNPSPLVSLKNILFAMDFSPSSLLAFPFAVGLARHYGSTVFVAHILSAEDYDSVPAAWQSALKAIETEMEEGLISPLGSLRDIPHEAVFDHGDICSKLLAMAAKCDSGLIVIGTHGREGVKKLLKGSTAEQIAYSATMPVLMVGPEVTRRSDFKQILYTCDISDRIMYALPYALSLADTYDATFILHANGWGIEGPVSDATPALVESFRKQLQLWRGGVGTRMVESLREQLHRYFFPQFWNSAEVFAVLQQLPSTTSSDCADVIVDFGPRAACILELIASRGIDLVVMSFDSKKGIEARIAAHLSESTAYTVAAQANCPVLVVPSSQAPAELGCSCR
jgi:nucleotide-binding universal stress UspA family protein